MTTNEETIVPTAPPVDDGAYSIEATTEDREVSSETRQKREFHIFVKNGQPIVLGSGRYATVLLASTSATLDNQELYAVKFLKRDPQSKIFNLIAYRRFLEEVANTRTISNAAEVVEFKGFGTLRPLKNHAPEDIDQYASAKRIVRDYLGDSSDVGGAFEQWSKPNQRTAAVLERLGLNLQGPFFVMGAGLGTLEEFLVHTYSWRSHPLAQHSNWVRNTLDRIGERTREDLIRFVQLFDLQKLGRDRSAFSILRLISDVCPQLANNIIFQLFDRMVESLMSIHDCKLEQASGLSHRDLKPGNFLLSLTSLEPKKFGLQLADLGFAAGRESALSLRSTMGGSVSEPGALAPGTFLFRGPEQSEPVYEVHYSLTDPSAERVAHSPKEVLATDSIFISNIGDIIVRPGDWFESTEVEIVHPGAPPAGEAGKTAKSRVIRTELKDGNRLLVVTLQNRVRAKQDRLYYHGHMIKLSGQHTDLFSMGALLYFMITGGKNPEAFFSRCIEPVPYWADQDVEEFYSDCLSLSVGLCLDTTENILGDIEQLEMGEDEKKRIKAKAKELGTFDSVYPEVKTTAGFLKNRDELENFVRRTQGHDLRESLRKMPSVRYYLSNASGQPLPLIAIYTICKLMMRDKKHCFVVSDEVASTEPRKKSYFDVSTNDKASLLRSLTAKALDSAPSLQYPKKYSFRTIGESPSEWLSTVRLHLDDIDELLKEKKTPAEEPAGH